MYNTQFSDKLKILEFLVTITNRLATNAFLIKTACITITGGIFYLMLDKKVETTAIKFFLIFVPILFWVTDAYYLYLERKFRDLYEAKSKKLFSEEDVTFFSLSLLKEDKCKEIKKYFSSFSSIINLLVYLLCCIFLIIACILTP